MARLLWVWALLLIACEPVEPPPSMEPAPSRARERVIRLAGDESATPLVGQLVSAFAVRYPGEVIVVESPIGNQGAEKALSAGLIDGALLLLPKADHPPARSVYLTSTEAVVVVGPGVLGRTLSVEALAQAIRGEGGHWHNGLKQQLLLRPMDHPAQRALGLANPALKAAFEGARGPVLLSDVDVRAALRSGPGVMAVADSGSLGLYGIPVWRVELTPSVRAPLNLYLLPPAEPKTRLKAFIDFVQGAEAEGLMEDFGFEAAP